jgi:chromosome segregation protein
LRQIKLAGFKSFVDPTQIDLPGRLVGVVGPNGCGKSNVIDAVRWVLGESKAAELRGESMQDVIFNGAANRKPAGRASVELVFDNTDGRLGGEWGRFAELSVKRVLTRDNTSSYMINQQQVRRRDVHDLFLGTGLGPRAYAIIGQGMISRIVEARPEELRVFLEEAAGVTKYKERRRETETRLSDARDNLARVGDVIRELDGQIERLQHQAQVARQFRELTARQEQAQALLWLARRDQHEAEQARFARDIEQAESAIEEQMAELRAVELRLEQERSAHYAANDAANAAHAELAGINARVAQFESEIRATVEARAHLKARIENLDESHRRRIEDGGALRQRHAELEAAAAQAAARLEQASAVLAAHEQALPAAEQAGAAAREALLAARALTASCTEQIAGAGQQMQVLERSASAQAARRERLEDEQRQLGRPDAARLERLQAEAAAAQTQLDQAQARGDQAETEAKALQAQRDAQTEARNRALAELHKVEARLQALRQTLANIEADERLDPWLRAQGLAGLPRLFQRLVVEAGWETAVEAVLRERVQAIEVGRLETLAAFGQVGNAATSTPPARVSFFSLGGASGAANSAPTLVSTAVPTAVPTAVRPWRRLSELVDLRDGPNSQGMAELLADWLAGVFVHDDLAGALTAREQLAPGEQFVVRAGHRVSRHAVRFFAPEDRKAGLLAGKREVEALTRQVAEQGEHVEQAGHALARLEAQLRQSQEQAQLARTESARLRAQMHEAQLQAVRLAESIERIRHRGGQIESELAELALEEEELARERETAQQRFASLDEALASAEERAEAARLDDERAAAALRLGREQGRQLEAERQRHEFEVAAVRERIGDLEHAIGVATADAERFAAELERAQLEHARLDDSAARASIAQALEERVAAEQAVTKARSLVDEAMARARASEDQRQKIERGIGPRRERVTELKLKEQAARLAAEQFAGQLAEAGSGAAGGLEPWIAHLRTQMPKETGPAALTGMEREIARLTQEIEALGAVNLAALEELDTATQRHGFLRAQSDDLNAAVTTLEDAIRKIDLETRSQLQHTFDEVNRHFGELFPRLFGGGEARLTMTGEEILDAGVLVSAQPPGKRNSSIHLLSGGEKALAATALVFALFKLNPAPFCLLDEVDAPLDDANTERFCGLVRSMSEATQFLFISHNKLAMEMAEQLVGVTMQEQGVSRIVAVDIESAVRLTAEAA